MILLESRKKSLWRKCKAKECSVGSELGKAKENFIHWKAPASHSANVENGENDLFRLKIRESNYYFLRFLQQSCNYLSCPKSCWTWTSLLVKRDCVWLCLETIKPQQNKFFRRLPGNPRISWTPWEGLVMTDSPREEPEGSSPASSGRITEKKYH